MPRRTAVVHVAAMLAALLAGGTALAEGDWRAQLGSALKAPLDLSIDDVRGPGADARELEARIRSTCVLPWLQVMADAVDASNDQLRASPLQALDGLLPAAAAVDKGMNRCIAAEGATGSASYLLDGRRYSTFAYVQKLRRIVVDMTEAGRIVAVDPPGAGPAAPAAPQPPAEAPVLRAAPPLPVPVIAPARPAAPAVASPRPAVQAPLPRPALPPSPVPKVAELPPPVPSPPRPIYVPPRIAEPQPVIVPEYVPRYVPRYYGGGRGGGCGSRGGPGWRKANGQCASWRD